MMSISRSTTWGGRSVTWGGRGRAALVGVLGAAVIVGGSGTAGAAQTADPGGPESAVVITGPGAAAAAHALGVQAPHGGLDSVAVGRVTAREAAHLRARGLSVVPDAPVQLEAFSSVEKSATGRINVNVATGMSLTSWTGKGVGVAVLDSGVASVPGLRGRVVQGANFTSESAEDLYGHGTFVAGLVAGDGTGPHGEQTGIIGTAPEATIISVKVADAQGRATVGSVIQGLAWTMRNKATYNIGVANLSLSTGAASSYLTDALDAVAEATWFSGITVVASAGNDGKKSVEASPGNDPFVLTAGSVNDANTYSVMDDVLSTYSNDGKTPDGHAKPEVLVSGQHVQSTLPVGSALAQQQVTKGLPTGYGQLSGTSMSAGVISGVAAAALQANPSWDPDKVKGAITKNTISRVLQANKIFNGNPQSANVGLRPSIALAVVYADQIAKKAVKDIAWNNVTWSNATWSNATWSNVTWSDATWSNLGWTNSAMTQYTSSDATWSNATWSSATWSSATWSSATWSS